ncbi:YaaA family protein [Aeromicrobium sp. 50.2.37]|uniref:YaaA family protein n=1 Tax=Aeromicrobium sp. 50.2.37 TaxID=2969305 RepID=UPI00215041C6|nr:peroxide stress protein YaaA [Aeromicrobium sp. 50.2.37]MCR4512053.1 peroxide stress protein YaaA [Aeromicrobium sp. 50.2.37]
MLIVLPPSEGKTAPPDGPVLDLAALSFPRLTQVRDQVSRALVRLAGTRRAAEVLGLGPTQADAVETDARLFEVPCAPAGEVYTGVLFGELDLATLDDAATARAERTVAVASALFGLVRVGDPIPAYRLSGTVTLPRLGPVAGRWRPVLPQVLDDEVADGLLVDLRSGAYVNLGKPSAALAPRTATVRVLHEQDGRRSVVSHFNKATKGRLVRALLTEGASPASVDELATAWRDLGWTVEQDGTRLDVVTTGAH